MDIRLMAFDLDGTLLGSDQARAGEEPAGAAKGGGKGNPADALFRPGL